MSTARTVAGIGALLTCPCHAVPLVLLAGGTAVGAWLARHLPLVMIVLASAFVLSLWLLVKPERDAQHRARV